MADYSVKVNADVSNYNNNIDSAAGATKKFQDAADDANKTLNDLGQKGAKSAKDLLKEMQNLEKGGRSVSNYRAKLGRLQKDIADLTINYRAMSKEMQNSDLGRETVLKIQELTKEAANYKDAILDAQASIKALASDTANLDAMKSGLDLVSGAMQSVAAAGILGADSTEKLVQVIANLQAVEKGFNGVQKVMTALQKESGLMMGIQRLQTAALTKATQLQTAATGKATIAQRVFNAVAKANPYVLLASIILTVVAAVAAYTLVLKKNKEQLDYTKKAQEAYKKALEDSKEEASNNIAKFSLLEQTYKRCRTEGEKKKWIDDNKDAMHDLGYEIKDVNDADELFVEHAKDVIQAMRLRAEAAAILAVYQEEYAKAVRDSYKMEQKAASGKKSWGSGPDWKKIKQAGLKEGEDYTYTPTQGIKYTKSGEEKMKKLGQQIGEDIREGASQELGTLIDSAVKLEAEAEKLDGKWRTTNKKSEDTKKNAGGMSKELKAAVGSLTEAQRKLSDMEEKFKAMNPNSSGFDKMKEAVEAQRNVVEELKKQYETIVEETKTEYEQLKEQNSEAEKLLSKLEPLSDEWKKQYDIVVDLEKKIKDVEDSVEGYKRRLANPIQALELPNNPIQGKAEVIPPTRAQLQEIWDGIQSDFQTIQQQYQIGIISKEQAEKEIADLNKKIKKYKFKGELSLDVDVKNLNTQVSDALKEYVNQFDKIGGVANGVVGSFNDIYESVTGLSERLDEADNAWEQFYVTFQAGMSIFNAFTTIVESVATALEILNVVKDAGTLATERESSSLRKNTKERLKNAMASGTQSALESGESVSSVPYVGPILAAAAIATILALVMSAMSKAKAYRTGGIVGGSDYNDGILARVSSGEMILNKDQQANLFKLLDSPSAGLGGKEVEFKIRGTELVGVLNNINKKNSKI